MSDSATIRNPHEKQPKIICDVGFTISEKLLASDKNYYKMVEADPVQTNLRLLRIGNKLKNSVINKRDGDENHKSYENNKQKMDEQVEDQSTKKSPKLTFTLEDFREKFNLPPAKPKIRNNLILMKVCGKRKWVRTTTELAGEIFFLCL